MKRPQFSLELMLLLVALAASILGWRTAVQELRRIELRAKIDDKIGMFKVMRLACQERRDDYQKLVESDDINIVYTKLVKQYQAAMLDMDQRIKELSK
jgi:hypothetical protein